LHDLHFSFVHMGGVIAYTFEIDVHASLVVDQPFTPGSDPGVQS
jgi:hypothetical protein